MEGVAPELAGTAGLDRQLRAQIQPLHALAQRDQRIQRLAEADILGPSEAFRQPMDYFAHAPQTAATLARLAQLKPGMLACMHGSAWRGDGAALLRHLAEALTPAR